MNKKGFTLVELLAVIMLLGIVMSIATLSITSISKKIKDRQFELKKQDIIIAAKKYAESTGIKKVYVDTLIKEGYYTADNSKLEVINPLNRSQTLNCYLIDFTSDDVQFTAGD